MKTLMIMIMIMVMIMIMIIIIMLSNTDNKSKIATMIMDADHGASCITAGVPLSTV